MPSATAQGMRLAHAISKPNLRPLNHPIFSTRTTQHAKIRKQTWQYVLSPPAKIATPTFGSDVAARRSRATLRVAVLHVPDVTLKMSTASETPPTAHCMRLAHAIGKPTSALAPLNHPITQPAQHTTQFGKDTKINMDIGNTYHRLQRRSRL